MARPVHIRSLIKTAGPLWGVAIALNMSDWYGLATVASTSGLDTTGVFRVAAQVASALAIISTGLFGVYAAKMSAAFGRSDHNGLGILVRQSTRLSTFLIVPPALLIFLFAEQLLALVGPGFSSGATMLRILLIGQLVSTMLGPAGITLAMTGHEKTNLRISIASTFGLLIAAPVLGGWLGPIGVAGAIAAAQIGRNVASVTAMYVLLGINPLTGARSSSRE